jgi:hypothetical protein
MLVSHSGSWNVAQRVATRDGSRVSADVRGEGKVAVTSGNAQPRISADVMPMTGGQGVASSNLASPTVKDLVGAELPAGRKTHQGPEADPVSESFQDPPARAAPRALAADLAPCSERRRLGADVDIRGMAQERRCVHYRHAGAVHSHGECVPDQMKMDDAESSLGGQPPEAVRIQLGAYRLA